MLLNQILSYIIQGCKLCSKILQIVIFGVVFFKIQYSFSIFSFFLCVPVVFFVKDYLHSWIIVSSPPLCRGQVGRAPCAAPSRPRPPPHHSPPPSSLTTPVRRLWHAGDSKLTIRALLSLCIFLLPYEHIFLRINLLILYKVATF